MSNKHLIVAKMTKKERGASPDARSTYLGLRIALLVETSNAESPTYDVYNNPMSDCWPSEVKSQCGFTIHLKGRPRCFVFD